MVWTTERGETVKAKCLDCPDGIWVLDPDHWESNCPICGSGDYRIIEE